MISMLARMALNDGELYPMAGLAMLAIFLWGLARLAGPREDDDD